MEKIMNRKQIYFIANGFQALDLFGPLESFMQTNALVDNAYTAQLLGIKKGIIKTDYGQQIQTELGLSCDFEINDLIICGGRGMRELQLSIKELELLRQIANKANRVFSICTGAFVLAKLYPEESLILTTHWRYCQSLQQQNKHVNVDPEPLFIQQENIWSSAGVLSGVDLALAVIKQDHGNTIAAQVAKELVIYVQRSGHQSQYSDMLKLQSGESAKLAPLLDWLKENVNNAINVAQMANKIHLSERQLTRLFKQHLNSTPSNYFRELKLNYARDLLSTETISMQNVATKIGFNSYDSFRRAFYKQFGVSPSTYLKGSLA